MYTLRTSSNPLSWVYATIGSDSITKDMIATDLSKREDVIINQHGVVCFYNTMIANFILMKYLILSK